MPVSSNSGRQQNADDQKSQSPLVARSHILVVDKDYELGKTIKAALESLGFEVSLAHDGNSAIAITELRNPDLMILDLQIPKRSGLLVMEYLAVNSEKPIPAIVITANEGSRHKKYSEMLGAVDYILKPFTMERLVSSVSSVLTKN